MPVKRAFVYILECADASFYIGTAQDVVRRTAVHNARRGAKYTRARLPVKVVYQEGPMTLTKALQREYQLKQLTRLKKQALILGTLIVKNLRPARRKRVSGKVVAVPRSKQVAKASTRQRGRKAASAAISAHAPVG